MAVTTTTEEKFNSLTTLYCEEEIDDDEIYRVEDVIEFLTACDPKAKVFIQTSDEKIMPVLEICRDGKKVFFINEDD